MLLDSIMPFYHFKEIHSIVIRARTKAIITAVKDITPAEIPFMFELLWLHALPSRLFSTKKKSDLEIVRKKPFFEQYLNSGFILLAEDENQELVLGRIAQFCRLRLISKQNKLFLVSARRANIGTREMVIRGPYRLAN
jgi:hypothetical protein